MKAFLHTKGLWTIVSGAEKCPDDSKANLQAKWDVRADKAAGQLYLSLSLSLSAEQRTHIDTVQDNPVQIWSTLESILLWEVNHRIPLINEGKQYLYHLPRCPDALKQQLLDKI